jgi:alkanesulfonate monooxygenase SsuD/methylene tetrahydromethanopterin reductase-like flavin-dependent oxidoreductase (luciferase family)
MGDGWIPQFQPDAHGKEQYERMREYAREYGRNPDEIGLDGRVALSGDDEDGWAEAISRWEQVGATHVSVNTLNQGLRNIDEHLDRLRRLKEAVGNRAASAAT